VPEIKNPIGAPGYLFITRGKKAASHTRKKELSLGYGLSGNGPGQLQKHLKAFRKSRVGGGEKKEG